MSPTIVFFWLHPYGARNFNEESKYSSNFIAVTHIAGLCGRFYNKSNM